MTLVLVLLKTLLSLLDIIVVPIPLLDIDMPVLPGLLL